MPRKSPEARAAATIVSKRPAPPSCLSPTAAKLWREIVQARPPEHFDAGSQPLLQSYVAVLDHVSRAEVGTPAHARMVKLAVTLAVKLRLTVQQNVHRRAGELDERSAPRSSLLGGNIAQFRARPDDAG